MHLRPGIRFVLSITLQYPEAKVRKMNRLARVTVILQSICARDIIP
jgi:hypothetical protein